MVQENRDDGCGYGAADALHDVQGCGGDRDGSLGDGGVGSADGRNRDGTHADGADKEDDADKPFREGGWRDDGESERSEKRDESSDAAGGKQEPDARGREMQDGQKVQGNQHLASEVEAIDEELRGGRGAEGWVAQELEINERCGARADGVADEGCQQRDRSDEKKDVAQLRGGIRAEDFQAVEQQYEARREKKKSDVIKAAAGLTCGVGRKNPSGEEHCEQADRKIDEEYPVP